jgi:hypothetical protein
VGGEGEAAEVEAVKCQSAGVVLCKYLTRRVTIEKTRRRLEPRRVRTDALLIVFSRETGHNHVPVSRLSNIPPRVVDKECIGS